ncbi:carbamoyl-phosphate synthase large subunit [Eikenella sp. Marseille-P7795]|uniref:carbamoyl-phosphate synthase large subunit n=1 Tax=Eikenella sp. Marseille-P7795 TaxID=2866577 RepID=UPI001CE416C4|nr:carbamoyl-phosphate synthase large subunit [Eikenella sp. Marseille-P7795]
MNLLITSPRAPVALEWARFARSGGHRVVFCDSLRFPVGAFAGLGEYRRIPPPRLDFAGYAQAMAELVAQADCVIPTCEDIFYLAKLDLPAAERAKCRMPDNETLFALHDKFRFFARMPQGTAVRFPETRRVASPDEVRLDDDTRKTVLKPVYSRFGRSVVRGVREGSLKHLRIGADYPWVQQEFIAGQGVCNYAVCERGKVLAHAAYRPRYLLNGAASTYFEPLHDSRLDEFVARFAAQNAYHGQAAFDFIDDGRDLWLIECNPRATSGLHLLRGRLAFDAAGSLVPQENPPPPRPLRVGASLPLLFGVQAWKRGTWAELWQDYRRAQDVIADLPFYAQWLALGEMVWRSARYRKPLTNASTFDIEFDGDGN